MEELHRSLQAKIKVIDNLQAELSSLQSLSAEMTKLQAENANLTREVSNMKPELTRLRSQNSSYQSVLSEKLSLERQLSTLEVELRAEKRISEKGRKSNVAEKDDTSLEGADVTVESETQIGKDSKQAPQPDTGKPVSAASKKQVKSKDQSSGLSPVRRQKPKASKEASENPPRRQNFGMDAAIGTPGPNQMSKLPTKISAAPGDKSIFSITPFLNRQSNDFETHFTSSESEDDGLSFAEPVASRTKVSGLSIRENGVSNTIPRKSIVQPQQKAAKPSIDTKSTNIAAPRVAKRTQKQKEAKELSSDDEERQDPTKKRRIIRTMSEKPLFDGNPGVMRTLSKQKPLLKDQSGILADADGKHFENDRRNRRLGSNRALDIPLFSPLKRNMRG
ncbi:uncharacterized protein GIQ15_01575 [Arthroderma uncinatum]|uniref:uncharacterized protein n=1 Tax=Arthroderma uncinatum TaxID=74035 RepID=UPI00144A7AAF|nr:uncharacterized protein GIQ15_01575 [Arthroderma uncinatum]KAF3492058.1 hypothetical protein GIQ15_01575 [Arthroderma uncinatum]